MNHFKYLYYVLLSDGSTYLVSANNRKHLKTRVNGQFALIKRTINGVF